MTREEAITALGDRNNLLWGMSKEEQKYYSEALDMAISALSESERAEMRAYFDGEAYGWEQGRKALIDDVKAEIETALVKEGNTDTAKAQAIALSWVLELLDRIGKESEGMRNESISCL